MISAWKELIHLISSQLKFEVLSASGITHHVDAGL